MKNQMHRLVLTCSLLAVFGLITTQNAQAAPGGRPLVAILTGAAEAPGPGDPDGVGIALVRLNPRTGQICYAIQVQDIATATAAHIHIAPAGVAGPVVVPLTAPDASGFASGCVDVDPELIKVIMKDPSAYYVNVHNSDFPGGAVRGQLTFIGR